MSSEYTNTAISRQYTAHKGDDLLGQVHKINCILGSHEMVACGYHPSNEILIVNSQTQTIKSWDTDFIEYCLLNDTLLAGTEFIKNIFISTDKCLLIPQELFTDETSAQQELRSLFFVEKDEIVDIVHTKESRIIVCFAYPKEAKDILEKYIAIPKVLPIQIAHISQRPADNLCQCIIGYKEAMISLQHRHRLLWQQHFEYANPEDIVYKIGSALQQYGIDPQQLQLQVSTTCAEHRPIAKKTEEYFNHIHQSKLAIADISSPEWSSTIRLFQQLNLCAS